MKKSSIYGNFAGVDPDNFRKMKPTKDHYPVLWECMLGTVYARNSRNETKFFNYDLEAAYEFAGLDNANDLRLAKYSQSDHSKYADDMVIKEDGTPVWGKQVARPSRSQLVLFARSAK